MAQTTKNDELNILGEKPKEHKQMAIPFEEYFGEMGIEEYQKQNRIFFAEDLSAELRRVFGLMLAASALGLELDNYYWADELKDGYMDLMRERGYDLSDDFYDEHISNASGSIIDTAVDNQDDPWYLSEDRADYLSEDEANSILNHAELVEAIKQGMTMKKWNTMKDRHVRKTHNKVDEKVIRIEKPFEVGGYQMMTPRDDTLGAGAEEIVRCRCWLTFSK